MVADAKSQTITWIDTYWVDGNVTRDDGSTAAAKMVMYADPPYHVEDELTAETDSVDALVTVGDPESEPLLDEEQNIYGYAERVPIKTFCIDKVGIITGSLLKWKMEAELRRIAENYPEGSYRTVERMRDNDVELGGFWLYSAEYTLYYERALT